MAKRAPRATPEQFEVMVSFMTAHSCLVHPKLSNSLPSTERDELWEELSSKLNNQTFGPKKTTFQWRRVWTDLKSEVKDKLAEINKKRQRGSTEEILNPCHKKVAILLAKASSQCAFIERKGLTVSAIAERERDVGVKNEESSIFQNTEIESSTSQPFVVTLNSIRNQPTGNESRNLVKCEISATNDSSDAETYVPPAQNVNATENIDSTQNIHSTQNTHSTQNIHSTQDINSIQNVTPVQNINCIEETPIVEDTMPFTVPVFNKAKPKTRRKRHHKTEDAQLSSLVEVEKEKSNMLLAIAEAIAASNESKKERLRIDEERNRLTQERNVIESERNEIFKSLLEHLVSKEVI